MKNPKVKFLLTAIASSIVGFQSAQALAQNSPGRTIEEVIVTAQKRQQSINEVPISMTVASGEALIKAGVKNTSDLAKIVPGFNAAPSPLNTPIYTMRGVGYVEFSLAATPTVAVYTDEVPLPFSAMTKAAGLDLERVEVLKGPQGTLYGQNTTGGAINFIAAKPSDEFEAGIDASYGRFNAFDVQGYLSGPLTDTLGARVALRSLQADDWQKNYTRNEELGEQDEFQGRILLDWQPTDWLTGTININGWVDKSDTQAPQLVGHKPNVPSNVDLAEAINNYPLAPYNARAADWAENKSLTRDDSFFQTSARFDITLSENMQLTSVSSYSEYETDAVQDFDGASLIMADVTTSGDIKSYYQELRLSGDSGPLLWLLGASYQEDEVRDDAGYHNTDSSTSVVAGLKGSQAGNTTQNDIKTTALFANLEYEVTDNISVQGGIRYTDYNRDFSGCGLVPTNVVEPFDGFGTIFEFLQELIHPGTPVIPVNQGDCYTFGQDFRPVITPFQSELNEDNISWRLGIDYKFEDSGLVYGSISKGYKGGNFPSAPAGSVEELVPVTQESLVAYEIGLKKPLFDNMMQFNSALFYYDYTDKQLRGRKINAVFGPLEALVQIPESKVQGAEAEIVLTPIDALTIRVATTYLDTEIEEYIGPNTVGETSDFSGQRFPFSPRWSVISGFDYNFPLNANINGFIGSNLTFNSATSSSVGNIPELEIKSYTLIDARVGIESTDARWRAELWGRNITDKYYWTGANAGTDTFMRFAGRPATYGIAVSHHF